MIKRSKYKMVAINPIISKLALKISIKKQILSEWIFFQSEAIYINTIYKKNSLIKDILVASKGMKKYTQCKENVRGAILMSTKVDFKRKISIGSFNNDKIIIWLGHENHKYTHISDVVP